MNKTKFIQQMINNHREKQYNKPQYILRNLFVAKIEKPCKSGNITIKDFAICEYYPNLDSSFSAINNANLPYDYVVANVRPFHIIMKDYIKEHNLNTFSQLSPKQIDDIEKELNSNQEYTIMFS